ncbi:hypothetical protein GCM10023350_22750 [Nocardioides endophyticus]|uniref:Thiamine pyrimidine synthase n=1 Tax=Nocardioides endophyticus TaxID=1353775 RepID=A0ABP8YUB0_9ACTN
MFSMKRWSAAAVAISMVLALAACGSDDESASAVSDPSAPLEKCDGTKIKFQLSFFPNAQYVALMVAQNRGFFEEAGVDVELVDGGPNISAPAQMGQGLADLGLLQFDETQNANLSGADFVWIGQYYQKSPVLFAAMKDTPFADGADLKGLTTNTNSGDLDPELHALMEQAGVAEDEVEIVPASPSVSDLINGTVDMYQLQRFFHVAEIESLGMSLEEDFNTIDANEAGVALPAHGVVANREFLDANPDAVGCFLAGLIKGVNTVLADPEGAVADVDAMSMEGLATHEQNIVNVQETIKLMSERPDGSPVDPLVIDEEWLADGQEQSLEFGILPEAPDLDTFVDPAPLARAEKLAETLG